MKLRSTDLQALVDAAREIGECTVLAEISDGTIVEIRFRPRPEGEPPREPTTPTSNPSFPPNPKHQENHHATH